MEPDSPIEQQQSQSVHSYLMPIILAAKTEQFINQPFSINSITENIIREASQIALSGYSYTNQNNFSIPIHIVTQLIEQISQMILDTKNSTNMQIQGQQNSRQFKILLGVNCLRIIINSTFKQSEQNEENKLVELLYMLFGAQINSKNNEYLNCEPSLQQITYIICLSQMIMFRMNQDHTISSLCPQVFRMVLIVLEKIRKYLQKDSKQKKNKEKSLKIFRIRKQKQPTIEKQQNKNMHQEQVYTKQKLIDKYNFSKKKNNTKNTQQQSDIVQQMTLTQLLELFYQFKNQSITSYQYSKILILWIIRIYQQLIKQSRKLGVRVKSIYTSQLSADKIKSILEKLLPYYQNSVQSKKNKNIYLKQHITQQQQANCKWQQIVTNQNLITEILHKINRLCPKQQQENAQQLEDSAEAVKQVMISTRQLTPRMYKQEQQGKLKLLRQKKKKLKKKIQSDMRRSTFDNAQQAKVLADVRAQKAKKSEKKEMFIMQKQTEQAKKLNTKMKKFKKIQKQVKGKGKK